MPKKLRLQIESMPRQAIYTLATREGSLEKKKEIVESYKGQTKTILLNEIREAFPLNLKDQRQKNKGDSFITLLERLHKELRLNPIHFSNAQKTALTSLLQGISKLIRPLV